MATKKKQNSAKDSLQEQPKQLNHLLEKSENAWDIARNFVNILVGTATSLYVLYQFWIGDRLAIIYFMIFALILALIYLIWFIWIHRMIPGDKRPIPAYIMMGLLFCGSVFLVYLFAQHGVSRNVLYSHSFESGSIQNNCWRVRPDQNNVLQGEKVAFTSEEKLLGEQSLRLDVNLSDPPGTGQSRIAQIDAGNKGNPACVENWMIPYQGRIQTWVCLPSAAAKQNINVSAELFLQYHEDNADQWNSSGPIKLVPGQWTRVLWDVDHDPLRAWRDWRTPAIALGLEIKFDENSPAKKYVGPLYMDEFVVTSDRGVYSFSLSDNQYTVSAGCP